MVLLGSSVAGRFAMAQKWPCFHRHLVAQTSLVKLGRLAIFWAHKTMVKPHFGFEAENRMMVHEHFRWCMRSFYRSFFLLVHKRVGHVEGFSQPCVAASN